MKLVKLKLMFGLLKYLMTRGRSCESSRTDVDINVPNPVLILSLLQ